MRAMRMTQSVSSATRTSARAPWSATAAQGTALEYSASLDRPRLVGHLKLMHEAVGSHDVNHSFPFTWRQNCRW